MLARFREVSGLSLLIGAVGLAMVYSSIANITVSDYFRAVIRGGTPPSGPSDLEASRKAVSDAGLRPNTSGTTTGDAVAKTAESYVGKVPYVWAGEDPDGWDCSGFVTWVLHHDHGIDLPDNVHTVTGTFYTWSGARTIPRESCAPGDLVCWLTHIGIAVDNQHMANAASPGTITRIDQIYDIPAPVIRRPKAYDEPGASGKGAI